MMSAINAMNAVRAAGAKGVCLYVRRALSICLLLAAAAFPDNVLAEISKAFRRDVDPATIAWMIIVFGALAGIMLYFYASSRRKHEKIQEDLSTSLFDQGCERARLTRDEMNVLNGIVAFAPDPDKKGYLIFESLPLYERCLEEYVAEIFPRLAASPERIKEYDELLLRLRKKMNYAILAPEQPIVSTRNLSVGQKMSVYVPGQKDDSFSASVAHVGEFWFKLRIQEDFMGLVNLGGAERILAFLRQGDASYTVTVKVREVLQGGEITFYHNIKLSRNQHRQYMRLDVNVPLKYRIVHREGFDERQSNSVLSAHTADISGGGVCLVAKEPLRVGDIIMLSIYIPGCPISDVESKVLRVIELSGRGNVQYRHLVQFVSIEPQDREKIVKYIFDKHREMLKMR